MVRTGAAVLVAMLLVLAGCLAQPSDMTLVPASPFGTRAPVPQPHRVSFAPAANTAAAARVDLLGRKIVAANPQIGLKPMFFTIGGPQPELFHHGTGELYVTEGLAQQCKTDGELAAVLCLELGRMVSEREALANPRTRVPDRQPPPEVPVGHDHAGTFGPADQTHLAELGKYEEERRRAAASPPLPPDPHYLASIYLKNAKYYETELDRVAPLLQAAAANNAFEKQITAGPARPWTN